jgi:hypothetical protein
MLRTEAAILSSAVLDADDAGLQTRAVVDAEDHLMILIGSTFLQDAYMLIHYNARFRK